MIPLPNIRLVSIACAGLFVMTMPLQAQISYRTIALTGLPAPGTAPGVNYDAFDSVLISESGQVAYRAGLTGPGVIDSVNDIGIYYEDGGTQTLVARGGDTPPGISDGVAYQDSSLGLFYLASGSDHVTFEAHFTGEGVTGTNDRGIAVGSAAGHQLAAILSDAAPGTGAGVLFTDIEVTATNEVGRSIAITELSGLGVSGDNDRALYTLGTSELALIAREGQQAPGAAPGANFTVLEGGAQINDTGRVAFTAHYDGGIGIFAHDAGGLQSVVLRDTAAPGAPAGTNFFDFDQFSINNVGSTAFRGFTDGPTGLSNGIYVEDSGVVPVVEQGQTAPGTFLNPEFQFLGQPLINTAGDVAFTTSLTGAAVNEGNNNAIYKAVGGELQIVARQNDLVPDASDSARFGELGNAIYFNDAGQVAFAIDLQGPSIVEDVNDIAIFAEIENELRLIARRGDLFDVDPDPLVEDLREIVSFSSSSRAGANDGRPSPFNAAGQFVFHLEFTDGSHGLFIAETGTTGDFDGDGSVDGFDFLNWQRGESPNPISVADLAAWEASYGQMIPASTLASAMAVPEPTSIGLLLGTLLLALARDSRAKRTSAML